MSFRFPSPLYAIADPDAALERDPVRLAWAILTGGARLVQLRWKTADADSLLAASREIARLCRDHGALFLVNDRVDVALAAGAAGVHLGQEDLPLPDAQRIAPELVVGISTHDLDQARAADAGGAAYVAFGPVFETGSKETGYTARGLSALAEVRKAVSRPIVAIGGIGPGRIRPTLASGADAVALISAIVAAPDVPRAVAESLAEGNG